MLVLFLLSLSCTAGVEVGQASGDFWLSKAPMQQARGYLGVAVVNNKIYAIGGCLGGYNYSSANEEYDPKSDTWVYKTPMPTARYNFGTAVYQNKIYCIGGLANADSDMYSPVVSGALEVYDPAKNSW